MSVRYVEREGVFGVPLLLFLHIFFEGKSLELLLSQTYDPGVVEEGFNLDQSVVTEVVVEGVQYREFRITNFLNFYLQIQYFFLRNHHNISIFVFQPERSNRIIGSEVPLFFVLEQIIVAEKTLGC